ncbi:MAG TPA: histidine kinase [Candidatus Dormibacteraeota bacterium]|nr:histidine kinase [Candidatus Dormibacteraeota bacterium]
MNQRKARRLAWFLLGLTLAIGAAFLALTIIDSTAVGFGNPVLVGLGLGFFLVFPALGLLIALRRPENPIGWLVLGFALWIQIQSFAGEYALRAFVIAPGSLPAAAFVAWFYPWVGQVATGAILPLLVLLFPTGRPPSPRWRPILWLIVIEAALEGVVYMVRPLELRAGNQGIYHQFALLPNPTGLPQLAGLINIALAVFNISLVLLILTCGAGMLSRFRRAASEERQQLKWFLYVVVLVCVDVLIAIPLGALTHSHWVGDIEWTVGAYAVAYGLPVATTIAVLKYRLYDIDLVINKSVVFGAMATFITAVYVAIVVGIGGLLGSGSRPNLALSVLATAIVAVAFQPVRERVQRLANRLVYGKRATPYEVLSQFSHRVAGTYSSEDVLPRMARVLSEGTGASRADVWIRLGDGIAPAASWPSGDGPVSPRVAISGQLLPAVPGVSRIVPVRHQGELLGALSINKRTGELLTPIEEKLLADLAAQAGLVLQTVRLTAELQARLTEISQQAVELRASRQRIVATQDAERRRLERNIHDGAQQNLVALTVRLRLATSLAKRDPERARASVKALESDSDQALETLRALASGIYPPLLREQGLAAAIRVEVAKLPFSVTLHAGHLERYPVEVEAAVYFVCLEALQNVTKHARASRVEINLRSSIHELSFEVSDDGAGFDVAREARGSGLRNMMDRIEGMGGWLEIRSTANGGTRVRGTVPIGAMEAVL